VRSPVPAPLYVVLRINEGLLSSFPVVFFPFARALLMGQKISPQLVSCLPLCKDRRGVHPFRRLVGCWRSLEPFFFGFFFLF